MQNEVFRALAKYCEQAFVQKDEVRISDGLEEVIKFYHLQVYSFTGRTSPQKWTDFYFFVFLQQIFSEEKISKIL